MLPRTLVGPAGSDPAGARPGRAEMGSLASDGGDGEGHAASGGSCDSQLRFLGPPTKTEAGRRFYSALEVAHRKYTLGEQGGS